MPACDITTPRSRIAAAARPLDPAFVPDPCSGVAGTPERPTAERVTGGGVPT